MLLKLTLSYFYVISYLVIAFRFVGRPGRYVYVFNSYRMEEVSTYEIQEEKSLTKRYAYSAFHQSPDNNKKK